MANPVVFSHKVSVKLDDNNFLLWRPQVLSAIRGHRLSEYISNSVQPPPKFLTNDDRLNGIVNPRFSEWEVQDQVLYSWLLSSMFDGILTRIVGAKTSTQVWHTLEVYFVTQTSAKIDFFTNQLQMCKKGGLSINEYLLRIKALVYRLGSVGHRVTVKEHISAIFKGHPSDYDTFIISVNSRNTDYTVAEIESLLLFQEHRMDSNHKDLDSVNLTTNRTPRGRGNSPPMSNSSTDLKQQSFPVKGGRGFWNPYVVAPRSTGVLAPLGSVPLGSNRTMQTLAFASGTKPVCQLCSRTGHIASRCYQRFNIEFPGVGAANVGSQSINIATAESLPDDAWYPDSGATTHCTADVNNFTQQTPYQGTDQVHMGDGTSITIQNVGKATFFTPYTSKPLTLNRMLHVPHITNNLISVSQFFADNNAFFEFYLNHYLVKDQASKAVLMEGQLSHGLYVIQPSQI
uniref:Retrovirus-related Pol polyprotein from transposon TNT 1-94-like beta-barrel domain-containing protein n=1 Tax=Cannabis sativa TaxID=3483 RepID=A0A803PSI1_CANSA